MISLATLISTDQLNVQRQIEVIIVAVVVVVELPQAPEDDLQKR